ncbi:MAG: DUF177 domain-containing protein [Bacteroidales bacterium]|nr:DUF177 domain-containing protein [Bacteroidales bacterium]
MSRKQDTTIQFSGLKSGRYTYDFELGNDFFAEFENDEIAAAEVRYDVILDKKEHTLVINFSFSGKVSTTCDRCLGLITLPVEGTETLCVKFSPDGEQCDSDDTVILPESATEIDLAQWFYEYVAVRLPMQHSHPEGACDPAMTAILEQSAPSATDHRWDALLDLKNQENKNN